MQQTTNPQKHWDSLTRLVDGITDKTGYPVDAGIKAAVVSVLAHGFRTEGSCEGHLDHGVAAPWIDLFENLPARYFTLLKKHGLPHKPGRPPQVDDVFAAYPELVALRDTNLREQQRFLLLLTDFYREHPGADDSRLSLIEIGCYGAVRLQSAGAGNQAQRTSSEQAAKLSTYQHEMQNFATWLKALL